MYSGTNINYLIVNCRPLLRETSHSKREMGNSTMTDVMNLLHLALQFEYTEEM